MQISLDINDLSNVRLMAPGPVLETMMAGQTLQARPPKAALTRSHLKWRRAVAPKVAASGPVRRVLEVGARPYSAVDLYLPSVGAADLAEGIDRLRRLGPQYYRLELELCSADHHPRHIPRWTEQLAAGDPRPREDLVNGVRLLHDIGLQEELVSAAVAVRRFLAARTQDLADGGINQLMNNLHPWISWHPPMITIDAPGSAPPGEPRRCGGRGIILTPSVFATAVQYCLDGAGELPSLLIFPITPSGEQPVRPGPGLEQLLGRKRAAILALLAREQLCTSDLARRCAISPGAVSEHTRILRDAGLITTDRSRLAMHRITPAGSTLIGDHVGLGAQAERLGSRDATG
ncbi:transcriptional regulator, ArsR family [Kribbella flavida DSM 17836]|uniref:Transcriptional regulator, ArsR family n=1 Tax=Kribbella flavida (strain DSM 17836 / JCM 10339 / NBRC 14399) TaxID=479435 RepID=D2PQ32_KRIFD|nr:winged helix-turn-helix domain-containing protein [Kribbella flavida]ADB32956.1 transcriptional regulator, ArsR family [Kribbella flavida DSM 17836]